jgi:hypothetical protein
MGASPEIAMDLGLGRLKVYEMLECTNPETRIPGCKVGHTWIVIACGLRTGNELLGPSFWNRELNIWRGVTNDRAEAEEPRRIPVLGTRSRRYRLDEKESATNLEVGIQDEDRCSGGRGCP